MINMSEYILMQYEKKLTAVWINDIAAQLFMSDCNSCI